MFYGNILMHFLFLTAFERMNVFQLFIQKLPETICKVRKLYNKNILVWIH